jgi:hypothetical protein
MSVIFPALVVIIKYTCLVSFSCNNKHCPRLVSSPILLYKIDLVCGVTNQGQNSSTINKGYLQFQSCFVGRETQQRTGWALSCQSIHHYNPVLTVICPRLVSSPILLYKIDWFVGSQTKDKAHSLSLFHKNRFQSHSPKFPYFAVDVVVSIHQANVFYFGTRFNIF